MSNMVTLKQVLAAGKRLTADYWADFTRATEADIARIETALEVSLPVEFREFYLKVGWGHFPESFGGGIYSPDQIVSECSVPIYFVTGSRFAGDPWASLEEHDALWISKGKSNPNPNRFTDEAMDLDGVKLWDLLMVGFDGCGGSHNIFVGDQIPPYRYCMIHQSVLESTAGSFFDGLHAQLEEHAELED